MLTFISQHIDTIKNVMYVHVQVLFVMQVQKLVIKNFLQELTESRDVSTYKKYGNKNGMKRDLWNTTTPTLRQFFCDQLYFSV